MKHARSFHLLVLTQFLTVFNDNLFKQTVLLLAVGAAGSVSTQSLASALFSIPFVLFAVVAGDCADRFPKRNMVVATKWAEAIVMLGAAVALFMGNFTALFVVVFFMGMQSAFLGPAKYGSLPELASAKELPRANGLFQASVLVGILVGTGSAGHIPDDRPDLLGFLGLGMAIIAVGGALVAQRMQTIPPAAPTKKIRFDPLRRLFTGLADAHKIPGLLPAIVGHACFWMCGSLMLLAWNEFLAAPEGQQPLIDVDPGTWSMGLAGLSLFMAAGAVVAGWRLQQRIPRWMPVFGALGMGAGFAFAGLVDPQPLNLFLCLGGASFFSGFYLIPLRSLMQKLPPAERIGATLGTAQMLDFLLISLGTASRLWLQDMGFGTQAVLIFAAGVFVVAAFMLSRFLPGYTDLSAAQSAD
ncbi:MAG: MFS transporter [Planctomycetes bacterium]|nr:MFS transporter [Planctomycetota bacterium]MCP4860968.1 MFS transporter [Planctomycetota bacterium]